MLDEVISRRQLSCEGGVLKSVLTAIAVICATASPAETILMMGREPGCMWCARWDAEIGPVYPKTTEGQSAPLLEVNLSEPLPDGIALNRPIVFTPTFVLLEDGTEIGRIEGYPGDNFFWGLLGQLLEQTKGGTGQSS